MTPSGPRPPRETLPADGLVRCGWVGDSDPLMRAYHDTEWGVVEQDDRALYEKVCLDGFQAGLSWSTILRKREAFRRVFDGFDPVRVASWDAARIAAALADPRIVRNRAKVEAAVANARAFLRLAESGARFCDLVWSATDGRRIVNHWTSLARLPAETPESVAMSRTLRAAGFRFCGPTICYAYMQAIGMVNDHLVTCFRHAQLS